MLIEKSIAIIAEDSPLESMRRLANMLKEVLNCSRKGGENIESYAYRFEGLAALYLNNCDYEVQSTLNISLRCSVWRMRCYQTRLMTTWYCN